MASTAEELLSVLIAFVISAAALPRAAIRIPTLPPHHPSRQKPPPHFLKHLHEPCDKLLRRFLQSELAFHALAVVLVFAELPIGRRRYHGVYGAVWQLAQAL